MNSFITLKSIVDEDFQDYKKASMFLAFPKCTFKCFTELGLHPSGCQNFRISKMKDIKIEVSKIFDKYISNRITSAVVLGGLEPFLSFDDVFCVIDHFRSNSCNDEIVIYTGYYPSEIKEKLSILKKFKNLIIKFGRFIPNSSSKFDELLGVNLASDNQFSEKIS